MTVSPPTIEPGLVSIVMPCYGGEAYLAEAIESCLAQTYANFELIVVDDSSPDGCLAIAERFARDEPRIRIVRRSRNGGVSRAFNSGFEVARGEYLTRLAQDDMFEPHAIDAMAGALKNSDLVADLVYCDSVSITSSGESLKVDHPPEPDDVLRLGNRVGLCVMWTRRVWESVGSFDPACDAAEDYDYWLRAADTFGFAKFHGPPAMKVRMHPEMGSVRSADRQVASTFLAVRKSAEQGLLSRTGWRRRRLAYAAARVTAVHVYTDQGRYAPAFAQLVLSLFDWPFPIRDSVSDARFARFAKLASLLGRLCEAAMGRARRPAALSAEPSPGSSAAASPRGGSRERSDLIS
jgi:glycosyltransferase involved in cell wall biosynthesis